MHRPQSLSCCAGPAAHCGKQLPRRPVDSSQIDTGTCLLTAGPPGRRRRGKIDRAIFRSSGRLSSLTALRTIGETICASVMCRFAGEAKKGRRRAPPRVWGRKSERGRIADPPTPHERTMQPGAPPRIDLDQRRRPTPCRARSGWSAKHQSPSARSVATDPTGSAANSTTRPPSCRDHWATSGDCGMSANVSNDHPVDRCWRAEPGSSGGDVRADVSATVIQTVRPPLVSRRADGSFQSNRPVLPLSTWLTRRHPSYATCSTTHGM